jgi:hypothetical protein
VLVDVDTEADLEHVRRTFDAMPVALR